MPSAYRQKPLFFVLSLIFIFIGLLRAAENPYFAIIMQDDQTGRGVPLVELRTTNEVSYFTDSNGVVAINEPGLMGRKIFFQVKSHGYEFPADGMGMRGVALDVKAGERTTIKIKRVNIAERLYRVTGADIYRDSVLAGIPVPIKEPLLNAQVYGQDSIQMCEYQSKLFWFWGDTNKPAYPLGHFGTSGATSLKPGAGGLDPSLGVDLTYFTDPTGFARPMCAIPGPGMKWMDGLCTVPDAQGKEQLVARFMRMKSLGEPYEKGWAIFNAEKNVFEMLAPIPKDHYLWHVPASLASKDREAWSGKVPAGQTEYVYFTIPFPMLRVPARLEALSDFKQYQGYTCIPAGGRFSGKDTLLERTPKGELAWAWKTDAQPLSPKQFDELVKAGLVKSDEYPFALKDAAGVSVLPAVGTVHYNDYRKKWIFIFHQTGGKPSHLGEVWFAEAPAPEGPWKSAVKIVTHDHYTFYNVAHHPELDQQGGKIIYFEGTYTAMFSGNDKLTPRYDYNQMMYRLDLSDPRLK